MTTTNGKEGFLHKGCTLSVLAELALQLLPWLTTADCLWAGGGEVRFVWPARSARVRADESDALVFGVLLSSALKAWNGFSFCWQRPSRVHPLCTAFDPADRLAARQQHRSSIVIHRHGEHVFYASQLLRPTYCQGALLAADQLHTVGVVT
jgi:hypothetical protein